MLESRNTLTKGMLKIERMEDLNKETNVEGPLINAVEFHPTSTVALVAGSSGVASIIQVPTSGKIDEKKARSCGRVITVFFFFLG